MSFELRQVVIKHKESNVYHEEDEEEEEQEEEECGWHVMFGFEKVKNILNKNINTYAYIVFQNQNQRWNL